jgi:hypothetical protein
MDIEAERYIEIAAGYFELKIWDEAVFNRKKRAL